MESPVRFGSVRFRSGPVPVPAVRFYRFFDFFRFGFIDYYFLYIFVFRFLFLKMFFKAFFKEFKFFIFLTGFARFSSPEVQNKNSKKNVFGQNFTKNEYFAYKAVLGS